MIEALTNSLCIHGWILLTTRKRQGAASILFQFFKSIFYWLYYYSCPNFFLPCIPLHLVLPPSPPALPFPHSSRPCIVHISSLASPFPTLFLTSPWLFCAYLFCFLFPVPVSPPSPPPPHCDYPHWLPSMWSPFLWFCSCSSCLLSFCFFRFSRW